MLDINFTNKDAWDKIAVTSDTHFGQKNIVKGLSIWSDPDNNCRPFDYQDEHDQTIIDNINSTVPKDGVLIHLGDWSFGGFKNIARFRYALQVQEVHLILGNHDHHIRNNENNCQNLFTSVNEKGLLSVLGQRIILDHYAHRIWWHSNKGNWMLYGHSHGNLEDDMYKKFKTMDVGLDAHPEFRPYLLSEIKTIMDKREIAKIDHH